MKQRRRKWQITGADPSIPVSTPTPQSQESLMISELQKKILLQDGTSERFEVMKVLGKGTQGRVTLVKDEHGDLSARKEIECQEHAAEVETRIRRLLAEVEVLNNISNENIVSSKLIYLDKKNRELHIIMDFMDCGSLMDLLVHLQDIPIPSVVTSSITKQVLLGLSALHFSECGKQYMHRDIKPENILLSWDGCCKLADFGVAKSISNTCNATIQSQIGNYAFMAPERMKPGGKYGSACDIWAVGMLTLNMLLGRYPFKVKAFFDIIKYITRFDLSQHTSGIDDVIVVEFLDSLLQIEPENRQSAKDALTHPFLNNSDPKKSISDFLHDRCDSLKKSLPSS